MITATKPAPMAKNSNHVQKMVTSVNKTADLSIFKLITGNRPPNPQHVKRLSDSIRRYGILCNPIIVNHDYEVIDGQHRLLAAKEVQSPVYYIVVEGYGLDEVHTLNLNQKNWTSQDFLEGYVRLGLPDYIQLKAFCENYPDFTLTDCIAMCSNLSSTNALGNKKDYNRTEVFNEGTWKIRDIEKAERSAQNILLIKPYYEGYNRTSFVGSMLDLMNNKYFDFDEFMAKLRLQPTALVDCANREQYKSLIETIYNHRRREKVNLRF